MARLSRTRQFEIYEDSGTATADFASENWETYNDSEDDEEVENDSKALVVAKVGATDLEHNLDDEDGKDAHDERRESALTTTTVSSFPESIISNDLDLIVSQYAYTPPTMRPAFRRPESVRRMQMSSPRQSMLTHSRSRTSTPRSVRSANARGSPRSRMRISEESDALEEDLKHHPLVLLHVTLLPVSVGWSLESMQELLPPQALENLQLLKSKISETVIQRGILIPHPREEYELLEDRLLEALELKDERITKCGHYRSESLSSTNSSGRDSDSAIGSSVDECEGELCAVCQNHIKTSRAAVGTGNKKWSIKVFAANGLMRSPAWAAAWSEMERVDVEILPWISEDTRQKLDERRLFEEAEEVDRREEEEERIRNIVEEEVRAAYAEMKRYDQDERDRQRWVAEPSSFQPSQTLPASSTQEPVLQDDPEPRSPPTELPQIYRQSEIPLSVLLKNYIFLLAQDRRNLAIFFLSVVALLFAMGLGATPPTTSLQSVAEVCVPYEPPVAVPSAILDGALNEALQVEELEPNEKLVDMSSEIIHDDSTHKEPEAAGVKEEVAPEHIDSIDEVYEEDGEEEGEEGGIRN